MMLGQTFMHGKASIDDGCTDDDDPYNDEQWEASNSELPMPLLFSSPHIMEI